MEHRNGQRLPLALPIRLHAGAGESAAVILDASCSGAFVATAGRYAPWTPVAIVVGAARIPARVVRVAPGGCAVEWAAFAPWEILEVLEERRAYLLGARPRRRVVRGRERPASTADGSGARDQGAAPRSPM